MPAGTGTAGVIVRGPRTASVTVDREGHRDYKVVYRVQADIPIGPNAALNTPGLPAFGEQYLLDGDYDLGAYRRRPVTVTPIQGEEGDPIRDYDIEFLYSTRPDSTCSEGLIDNPLLQPQKVSGSFVQEREEATFDRFLQPINNSAHEPIRGSQVEFDSGYDTVSVEQNVATLQLGLVTSLRNHVNSVPMWGLSPRCVKLMSFRWDQKYYGQCFSYYTRHFEFGIRFGTWDRDVLDEGTKVLRGHWDILTGGWILDDVGGSPPDPTNPRHFIRFKDFNGENARVVLNGAGLPAEVAILSGSGTGTGTSTGDPGQIHVEKYDESDLVTLLGLPASL